MLNKLYIYSHRQFYLNATHERLRNTPISLELCHFEKSYIVGFFFYLKKEFDLAPPSLDNSICQDI